MHPKIIKSTTIS